MLLLSAVCCPSVIAGFGNTPGAWSLAGGGSSLSELALAAFCTMEELFPLEVEDKVSVLLSLVIPSGSCNSVSTAITSFCFLIAS